jgi:hypothetical protein
MASLDQKGMLADAAMPPTATLFFSTLRRLLSVMSLFLLSGLLASAIKISSEKLVFVLADYSSRYRNSQLRLCRLEQVAGLS